jgi:hypothetical protein
VGGVESGDKARYARLLDVLGLVSGRGREGELLMRRLKRTINQPPNKRSSRNRFAGHDQDKWWVPTDPQKDNRHRHQHHQRTKHHHQRTKHQAPSTNSDEAHLFKRLHNAVHVASAPRPAERARDRPSHRDRAGQVVVGVLGGTTDPIKGHKKRAQDEPHAVLHQRNQHASPTTTV